MCSALSGLCFAGDRVPRALPWAVLFCPFGASVVAISKAMLRESTVSTSGAARAEGHHMTAKAKLALVGNQSRSQALKGETIEYS